MKLRSYQLECIDAIFEFFRTHPDPKDNPVCALPTAAGKAVIIAGFMQRVLQTWPGQRILNLVHVKELVEQNADKLKQMWPQAPLGVYSAGLGSKVAHMPITFAGVQSVARNLTAFGPQDIVFVDEVHLVPPNEDTLYRKVLAYFKARNPNVRFIGLSATIYRLGLGMITDGGVFTHVAYDICTRGAFNKLIDEGYLCPLIPMRTDTVLSVQGVRKQGGEFVAGELERAVNKEEITRAAVAELVEKAHDRNHWLIFASGIDHARAILDELALHNIPCTGVWGTMGVVERDANIKAFKTGQVRALVNCQVLTTGFDFPALDCIDVMRPTNSPVLHVQIMGRGTRPYYAPGFDLETTEGRLAAIATSHKPQCLILDHAGNTLRLGPINDPRIPGKKGEGTGDIPVKVCNLCGCLCHISARVCDNCGEEFQFETKLTAQASTAALIVRDEPVVQVFDVKRMTYEPHFKPGSPPSLKVSYYCGIRRFNEWVHLEHHGRPILPKAHRWWKERSYTDPPKTVAEAMQIVDSIKRPKQIRVWVNTRYPEVLSHVF